MRIYQLTGQDVLAELLPFYADVSILRMAVNECYSANSRALSWVGCMGVVLAVVTNNAESLAWYKEQARRRNFELVLPDPALYRDEPTKELTHG